MSSQPPCGRPGRPCFELLCLAVLLAIALEVSAFQYFLVRKRGVMLKRVTKTRFSTLRQRSTPSAQQLVNEKPTTTTPPRLDSRGCPIHELHLTDDEMRDIYHPGPLTGSVYAILAVFSGRGDRMRLFLAHADRLLQEGKLQEVHLWRRTVGLDAAWLTEMAKKERYSLHDMQGGWTSVYRHYAERGISGVFDRRVVVVKADDDTVWLDLHRFREYVEHAARRTEMLLVHANVVNNGVAAYYQFRRPPLNGTELARKLQHYPPHGFYGPLWDKLNGSMTASYKVHELFLKNQKAFSWREGESCIAFKPPGSCVQERFSINFFAARLPAWRVLAKLVAVNGDDEHMVTTQANNLGHRQCFFTPFNTVHLSFQGQHMNMQHLPAYKRLALQKNLTLPPHPAPWCEEGFMHSDAASLPFHVERGNLSARSCLATCEQQENCTGVVLVMRGCGLLMDECRLHRQVFPVAKVASACHCVLPRGARVQG